mgnify:CR=1 FL=1
MTAISLDPRAVAETLGVTTLDLATFLRGQAAWLMRETVPIAKNDPWFSHEDAVAQFGELDDLIERAKRLMAAAFECDRCYCEDNPNDDEES